MRPHRARLVVTLALAIAAAAADVAPIHLVREILDRAVRPGDNVTLSLLAAAFGVSVLVREGVTIALRGASIGVIERILRDMRWALFDRIVGQSLDYFRKLGVGEATSRILNDVQALQHTLSLAILSLVSSGLIALGIIGYLFTLDARLGALVVIVLPCHALAQRPFTSRLRPRDRDVRNESDALTAELIETFSNVEDVQANQGEGRQRKRIGARLESLRAANTRVFELYALSQSAGGLVSGIATLLILAVGGSMTMGGSLTVGGLIAFVTAVGLLLRAMEDITYFGTQLRGTGAIASRVGEVLNAGMTIADGPGAVPLEPVAPAIEFRGVTFGYDAGHPVLDGFTLEVPAGQRVGLVGASGSGKSTVIRLIQRFYDVRAGSVRVGGRDVRDLKLASLRSQIASVPQRPAIFHASVRENITFGIPEHDPLVPGALAAVRLDVELADKGGEAYEVGAAGANLSEGQKQRLAIARALVRDAPVLLLDEVTSALDAVNQKAVQDALDELLARGKRRTCIVVAHRLSTLRFVDRVVLIEGGRVVEDGSYDDLLARKGRFAALHDALAPAIVPAS